jgi:hypothetical protein
VIDQPVSKLGLHWGNQYKHSNWVDYINARAMSGLLLSDSADWWKLKALIDSTRYPIDRVTSWKPGGFPDGDPARLAEGWFAHFLERAMPDTRVTGVAGRDACLYAFNQGKRLWTIAVNEQGLSYRLGQFEAYRAALLAEVGGGAIIGNHAVGTSSPEAVADFIAGFEDVAERLGHSPAQLPVLVGIHEYWRFPWDWLARHQGPLLGFWEDHPPLVGIGEKAYLLNRWWHDSWPAWALFILTETGADFIGGLMGSGAGWRETQGWWRQHHARGKERDFYAQLLIWQDKQLQLDSRVLAHNVFIAGRNYGQWGSFDIGDTPHIRKALDHVVASGRVGERYVQRRARWFNWHLARLANSVTGRYDSGDVH